MNSNFIIQAENATKFQIKVNLLKKYIGNEATFEFLKKWVSPPQSKENFDFIIKKIDEKLLELEREAKIIETELNKQVKSISKETIQYLEDGYAKFKNGDIA